MMPSPIAGGLQLEQLGIAPTRGNKLFVRTSLHDLPVLQNENAVCHPHGREPVRDQNRSLSQAEIPKPLKDLILRAGVESGGWLVQDEHLGIPHVSASNGDLLPFAPGEIRPLMEPLAERLVIAPWQALDDAISEAALRRLPDPVAIIGGLCRCSPRP